MLFDKQYNEYDTIYSVTHYIQGFLIFLLTSVYNNNVLLVYSMCYQSGQYFYNIRIYIPRLEIKQGHNFKHLVNKVSEYVSGYVIGWTINKFLTYNQLLESEK